MPLYEYQCDDCGHRFERIQKFSDKKVRACPSCGGKVQKLFSSPAIQFKGTGWYITDYARKPGGPPAEAKKSDTSDSKGSDSKGSDSSTSSKSADSSTSKDSGSKTSSSDSKKTTSSN